MKDMDLVKLQTQYMQKDKTTQAMCATLTCHLQQVFQDIQKCLILARVDYLPEDVLDELAHELHIEWYDATADIDVKRALIKNSDKVHMHLGTPYAVEQVVEDYFGEGKVEEWFDYGGQPYYFRVITPNAAVTSEQANQFAQAVEKVKNARSRLEQVIVSMTADHNLYVGIILQMGDQYTVEQVV